MFAKTKIAHEKSKTDACALLLAKGLRFRFFMGDFLTLLSNGGINLPEENAVDIRIIRSGDKISLKNVISNVKRRIYAIE